MIKLEWKIYTVWDLSNVRMFSKNSKEFLNSILFDSKSCEKSSKVQHMIWVSKQDFDFHSFVHKFKAFVVNLSHGHHSFRVT